MQSVLNAVRHLIGAIGFVCAAVLAYYALTLVMWLLSWIVVLLGSVVVGGIAYEWLRTQSFEQVADRATTLFTRARGLATSAVARFN